MLGGSHHFFKNIMLTGLPRVQNRFGFGRVGNLSDSESSGQAMTGFRAYGGNSVNHDSSGGNSYFFSYVSGNVVKKYQQSYCLLLS